jgi:hypothetical protein
MFFLHSLTCVSWSDVLCNVFPHFFPPETYLQILIHLRATKVNRVPRVVSFLQYQLLDLLASGYTYAILQPQCALLVEAVIGRLASCHQVFHFFNFWTSLLRLLNWSSRVYFTLNSFSYPVSTISSSSFSISSNSVGCSFCTIRLL